MNKRDTYLEQQQTEKIETEVRNVDGIRIMKVYACCTLDPSKFAITTTLKPLITRKSPLQVITHQLHRILQVITHQLHRILQVITHQLHHIQYIQ
jgi:hypothetical protein